MVEYVDCPELLSATVCRLVVPSKKVTDPEVTLVPPDVTVAVSVTEIPTLIEEPERVKVVVVNAGPDCVDVLPPPPPQPEVKLIAAKRIGDITNG